MIELKKILKKENVCFLQGKSKEEVIDELISLANQSKRIPDIAQFKEALLYREKLMSTGIGYGIAIPHVRVEGIGDPIVIVGVARDGVSDYQSIDQEAIKIVILIAVEKARHKDHIQLLSMFMGKLKEKEIRNQVIGSSNVDDVHDYLINHT